MQLFAKEPVLTIGGIAAAIVALLTVFGVTLDKSTVESLVAVAVPLIVAGLARRQVIPVAKVEDERNPLRVKR